MFVAWKTPLPGFTWIRPPRRVAVICLAVLALPFVAACQQPARQGEARELPPPQGPSASAPAVQTDQQLPPPVVQDKPPPSVSPPANPQLEHREEPPPAAWETDAQEAERLAALARLLAQAGPRRPTPSWVIFREAFEETEDATCEAEWTGGNRLEVHTENIKRLTLDLGRLPSGAPQRGPWNLQLDSQGIQITGFRGKVLDLVRSKAGNWTVDRSKFKK